MMISLIIVGMVLAVAAAVFTTVYLQYRSQNGAIRITKERPISVQYISPIPTVDKFLPLSRSTPRTYPNQVNNQLSFRSNVNSRYRSFEPKSFDLDIVDNQINNESNISINHSFNKSISERSRKEDSIRRQYIVKLQPVAQMATPKVIPFLPAFSQSTPNGYDMPAVQSPKDVNMERKPVERSQKRRIVHEDESPQKMANDVLTNKKSKINEPLVKNTMKRNRIGLAPEDDLVFDIPIKRIRNNEIFSSYSSSLKRIGSPTETPRPKKRTVLEELELLSSQDSPYIQNVYGGPGPSSDKKSLKTDKKEPEMSNTVVMESLIAEDPEPVEESEMIQEDIPHTIIEKIGEEVTIIDDGEIIKDYDTWSDSDEEVPKYEVPLITKKEVMYDREKDKKRLQNFLSAVDANLSNYSPAATPAPVVKTDAQTPNNVVTDDKPTEKKPIEEIKEPEKTTSLPVFGQINSLPETNTIAKVESMVNQEKNNVQNKPVDIPKFTFGVPASKPDEKKVEVLPAQTKPAEPIKFAFGAANGGSALTNQPEKVEEKKIETQTKPAEPFKFTFNAGNNGNIIQAPKLEEKKADMPSTQTSSSKGFQFVFNAGTSGTGGIQAPKVDEKNNNIATNSSEAVKFTFGAGSSNTAFQAPKLDEKNNNIQSNPTQGFQFNFGAANSNVNFQAPKIDIQPSTFAFDNKKPTFQFGSSNSAFTTNKPENNVFVSANITLPNSSKAFGNALTSTPFSKLSQDNTANSSIGVPTISFNSTLPVFGNKFQNGS